MGIFGPKTTTTDNTGGHPGSITMGAPNSVGGLVLPSEYVDALCRAQDMAVMQAMHPPHIFTTANRYDISSDGTRKLMICMRMRTDEMPFQHLSTAHSGDKVFVFVVQNGQPVTLEDDASLFPSDRLISQLTLLK